MLRVTDIIDRKNGDCIGIKRLGSLGYRIFPETKPTHVYIWFTHFFELSELITDMVSAEMLNPGSTNKWIKFVRCICERDMYQRQPVHDSKNCSHCRRYFDKLENKSVWWLYIGNDKFIRLTFKDFIEENTFECCVSWIKKSGLLEVQLEVEDASVGCSIRRSFSVVRNYSYPVSSEIINPWVCWKKIRYFFECVVRGGGFVDFVDVVWVSNDK